MIDSGKERVSLDTLNRVTKDTPWGVLISSVITLGGKTLYDVEFISGETTNMHFLKDCSRVRTFKRLCEMYGLES